MDIQTIFYTMGIIFMSIMFAFMIALIALLFYIKNRVTQLQENIQQKIELAASVGQVGGKAVEVAVDKLKDFIEKKSKEKTKKEN